MKLEITVEETREVMMVGGAREKRRAEEVRPIPQLGHRPKAELKEGRARGTIDRHGADGGRDLGEAEEKIRPGDTNGSGDQGRVAVTSV